ncbi:MAG: thermostable hemolysin delta-VPH [Clostridia bacterium]|nr:thermostable hemolysin delta-VPH [Clostridia bacterium]
MYFNYHAKAQNLIITGHLVKFEFVNSYNKISPALVLYFDNNIPMPIREHKFDEYMALISSTDFKQ